jgi:serine/threonine protein kinase
MSAHQNNIGRGRKMEFIDQYDNGKWRVESLISEGNFEKVYKISKEEHGCIVLATLKVISVPHSSAEIHQLMSEGMDEGDISQYLDKALQDIMNVNFVNEFNGTSNIVSCENFQIIKKKDEFSVLIRMELLESLENIRMLRRLDEAEVAKLGIDICKALELLAKNNTIHRDVKPDNIMMSKNGDYKLSDFGVAQLYKPQILFRMDTPDYMSPEVFRGQEFGASAGIYSLGLVLYHLMNNGQLPFISDNAKSISRSDREAALVRRMKGEAIPPPAYASEEMAHIILKACAYDSGQRYQSAIEMRSDLERLLSSGIAKRKMAPVWQDTDVAGTIKEDKPPYEITIKKNQTGDSGAYEKYCNDKIVLEFPGKDRAVPRNKVEIGGEYYEISIKKLKFEKIKLSSSDLLQLSQFANLVEIEMINCKIEDLSPMSGLINLASLNLTGNQIVDASPLSGLSNLTNLNLSGNKIVDIGSLAALNNLTSLNLEKNEIKDVTSLFGLIKLTVLNLSDNQIRHISSLSELFNLTDINVDGNHIADVSPLSELYKLNNLILGHNPIRDLKPLCKLIKPGKIDLSGVPADNIQIRAIRTAFRNCTIVR